MKKILLHILLPALLLVFGLAFLFSCEETIFSPKKDGSSVKVYIKGNKLNVCKGDTIISNAPFAQFACVHKNGNSLDTLFAGRLDENGEWDSVYNIELLGIPDVRVDGYLDLRKATDSIFYICCDTSFVLNFVYNCDEVEEAEVDCNDLNDTINLDLTNLLGGKILLGSLPSDISGNTFQLSLNENITVDVNQAKNLSGDFTADISVTTDASGIVQLGNGNPPLVIKFFVRTDVPGVYSNTIELPTACSGQASSGKIVINLNAEVTDNNCACPYSSGNSDVTAYYPFSQSIPLGSTVNYSNEIINANNLMLNEGCYLIIDSISRYQSNVPVNTTGNTARHGWIITNPARGLELRGQVSSYSPSLTFSPAEVGESTDTFEVHVSIHNSAGESRDNCSFLISYTGDCCSVNICPSITKLNDLPANLVDAGTGTVIRGLAFAAKIDMGSANNIEQTMSGQMGTLCTQFSGDNQLASYAISLPQLDSIVPCSDVMVTVSILPDGTVDDTQWFSLVNSSFSITEGEQSIFGVQFETPDVQTYIASVANGHSSVYNAKLLIRAHDSYGELCSQQINLEANVSSKNYKISKSTNMKAFSQISDKESNPSYSAYKIDEYNLIYKYYGQVDKLDPDRGTVNELTNPPTPNSDHSFFFEVDDPDNLTSRQLPKLYLVNTELNKYSMITEQPVARYSTNAAFDADLSNLMEDIFKSNFQSRGNAPYTSFNFTSTLSEVMWDNSLSAANLEGTANGLTVNMGEVYIIWNPSGNHELFSYGGNNYSNYCDVALIYIEEVSDGSGSAHNIGNVTFSVVYPLTTIIQ